MGALDPLMYAQNYEQFETMTPDEMAAAMRDMLDSYTTIPGGCMPILGTIIYCAFPPVAALAAGLLLPADNSWHLKADYPEYWQACIDSGKSAVYDRSDDYFSTPALTSVFIKAEGVGSLGDGGGQDNVTLITANLPAHTHAAEVTSGTGLAVAPGELPVALPEVPGITGSTGSATAFDNRPAFRNELAYVRVR